MTSPAKQDTPSFPFYVREMRESDIPEVFHVRVSTREHSYTRDELTELGITPESVAEKMRTTYKGWVCEDNGRIVGFAMGNRADGEMWVIAVLPEYEGMGIGGKLLTSVEKWLVSSGCRELWVTTGKDDKMRTYGFYLHFGCTPAEIEGDIIYMRKEMNDGDQTV